MVVAKVFVYHIGVHVGVWVGATAIGRVTKTRIYPFLFNFRSLVMPLVHNVSNVALAFFILKVFFLYELDSINVLGSQSVQLLDRNVILLVVIRHAAERIKLIFILMSVVVRVGEDGVYILFLHALLQVSHARLEVADQVAAYFLWLPVVRRQARAIKPWALCITESATERSQMLPMSLLHQFSQIRILHWNQTLV
jgi:hypothetical protein